MSAFSKKQPNFLLQMRLSSFIKLCGSIKFRTVSSDIMAIVGPGVHNFFYKNQ